MYNLFNFCLYVYTFKNLNFFMDLQLKLIRIFLFCVSNVQGNKVYSNFYFIHLGKNCKLWKISKYKGSIIIKITLNI